MKKKILIIKCSGDVEEHRGKVGEINGYTESGYPYSTIDDGNPLGVMPCYPLIFKEL